MGLQQGYRRVSWPGLLESVDEYLSTPPIPVGHHQLCHLALLPRFNLSHRDIEDLLADRGITVSRESIPLWCIKFGAIHSRRLKRRFCGYDDTLYIGEVFVKTSGTQHCRTSSES
jgi:hypothetical protein